MGLKHKDIISDTDPTLTAEKWNAEHILELYANESDLPTPGIEGRLALVGPYSNGAKYRLFRDTGTAWEKVADMITGQNGFPKFPTISEESNFPSSADLFEVLFQPNKRMLWYWDGTSWKHIDGHFLLAVHTAGTLSTGVTITSTTYTEITSVTFNSIYDTRPNYVFIYAKGNVKNVSGDDVIGECSIRIELYDSDLNPLMGEAITVRIMDDEKVPFYIGRFYSVSGGQSGLKVALEAKTYTGKSFEFGTNNVIRIAVIK